MAYTVGSASVDIVPDFRGAQLAITAFFNKQKGGIEVPVKPVFDQNSKDVEQQAARLGSRVSKAMNDAAARNQSAADKLALQMAQGAEKSKLKAHAEALRINAQMDRDAAREQRELLDLGEAIAQGRDRARLQAHAEALRINAAMDRKAAQSLQAAHAEAIRIDLAMERKAAQDRKKIADDAARAKIEAERLVSRTLKEIAADRIRAEKEAQREEARTRQQFAREELNFARRSAIAIRSTVQQALADRRAKIQVEIDKRKAIEDGRETGGLISRAVEQEIHQNAGLISAVIGGVLIAGAPAALAAASTLFFGIGAVAAAQSQQIRSTWVGLWDEIKDGAKSDAQILVPTFERMAGAIGQSFQRMRPQVRAAFEDLAPQIDSFTASLTDAAEFALPGLVAAVREGDPVIQGLGDLLESIGAGAGEFFEVLSTHAPAAGGALTALGGTMRELLPLLAELLGQGAETATVVLPALTSALSGLHAVLGAVGGALPTVLTSILAFRVVQGTGRFLKNFAADMSFAALKGGAFASVQGRLATGASKLARGIPALGAAVGVVGLIFAESERQISDWTQALNEGGDAASQARLEMAQFDDGVQSLTGGFGGFIRRATGMTGLIGVIADDTDEAREANRKWLESLTPLERAQRNLDIATRALSSGLDDENVSAEELAGMQTRVERATAQVAREQERLERATRGVTEAMAEQADQARAMVDSAFAYTDALDDARQSQKDYNDAVAEFGANSDEARDALHELNKALLDVVFAAGDKAFDALPASMDESQAAILRAKAELDELNRLVAEGWDIPPDVETYRQQLEQITGQADGAMLAQAQLTAAIGELGFAVESIPGTKTIEIQAPTDELKARLLDLGFTVVEMPDGSIQVTAETQEAQDNLGNLKGLLADVDTAAPEPEVSLNDNAFTQTYNNLQGNIDRLNGERPEPVASMEDGPFMGTWTGVTGLIDDLDGQRPNPVLSASDRATPIIGSVLALIRSIPPSTSTTITANYVTKYTTIGSRPTNAGPAVAAPALGGAFENGAYFKKMAFGGAVDGRGGPWDDVIPVLASNGEHMFDAGDVAALGGQKATFDFRKMLHSGALGSPPIGDNIRRMVQRGNDPVTPSSSTRSVTIQALNDPRLIVKAMRDEQERHDALALPPSWGG